MSDQSTTLFDRAFAVGIAFLLPGLIALFGVATVNETVASWFGAAQSSPTVGGLVFVLVAALALNIVINGLRWFVFEYWKWPKKWFPLVEPPPQLNMERRREHEAQYTALLHAHYYHYLANANTAIAIPVAVTVWKYGTANPEPPLGLYLSILIGGLFTSFVLAAAALDAMRRYNHRRLELLGEVATPAPEPAATTAS